MAPPKRKQPEKRKTSAKKGGNRSWLALFLGLALLAVLGLGWFLLWTPAVDESDFTRDWVESVLIAAEVNLDVDRQINMQDGVERWKIDIGSRKQRSAVLKALETGVKARNGKIHIDDELIREGRTYQVAELSKANGEMLRLIFELSTKKPKPPKPKKPKSTYPRESIAEAEVKPVVPKPVEPSAPSNEAVAANTPQPAPDQTPETAPVPPAAQVETPALKGKGLIAVILDDIGHDPVEKLDPVLNLKYPITFAILPYLSKTKACAYALHQRQYEVILHMPMEPESYPRANPGHGAILSHHNEQEIRGAVTNALEAVPFVTGVNNHMGSRITAREEMMMPVLDVIKSRDLFFVDSRTQNNTVGFKLAKGLGMRTGLRDVFLDTKQDYDFTVKQMEEARRIARQQGSAIVIGHPYPTTLRALVDVMPKYDQEGYRFVFASTLVKTYTGQL